MTNAVYTLIVRALSGIVSERAAETLLRAALREAGLTPEGVTAGEMTRVLSGPLLVRLTGVLPEARARAEVQALTRQLQAAPVPAEEDPLALSADDFEFDDPEYAAAPPERRYALGSAAGQDALIQDLGRIQGVQGVMVCRANGEVLRQRALTGAANLGSVIAATALLFQKRALRLMAADMGTQTVCMRPVGEYCVAVVASSQVNIGRLLAELGQIREAA
ncbi:roadblock/LC7 domain-containing protein [Deinococcus sp. YIM 77859]|uniref:roadblock/LC7 domain-containing protein n=1 Tax=Deinococcus sp. YIM 77859 TaxID=1540221 RepID=UPI000557BDA1|nr:roadblock/LC7 domain-containing protein [Deinococcus sp. YIM 77859]